MTIAAGPRSDQNSGRPAHARHSSRIYVYHIYVGQRIAEARTRRAAMEKLDRAAVENLDPTQRAELLLHLERPDVSDERRQQILDALARATAPRPGEGQARKMQDWLLFPLFLQQRHWQLLQASEGGELPKIRGISRHLAELGLRAPSEHTMAMIVSVLHGGKLDHWDPQKLHNYFLTVKGLVRPELQRWKSAAQIVPQELVPHAGELPSRLQRGSSGAAADAWWHDGAAERGQDSAVLRWPRQRARQRPRRRA